MNQEPGGHKIKDLGSSAEEKELILEKYIISLETIWKEKKLDIF